MMGMMGMMGAMGLFWLLLIVGGIALVVWAVNRGTDSRRGSEQSRDDRAFASLRERFARGEIDEAEYRERRRVLEME